MIPPMESFFPLDEPTLEWRSTGGMGRRYQLLSKRGPIAEVAFGTRLRRDTLIATTHQTWRLHGTEKRIEVASGGPILAAKDPTGTKWLLSDPGLRLEVTNPWGTDWQWLDDHGNGLIGFRQKGFARLAVSVFLDDAALQHPHTPFLLGLGFCTLFEKASRADAA